MDESRFGPSGGPRPAGPTSAEPGDKPSVRSIAAAVGVSVATVSRVLNNHPDVSEAMRRRVMESARTLGYVPSSGKRPTDYIALTYPAEATLPYFGGFESLIIAGVLQSSTEHGFNLAVLNAARDKHPVEGYLQFLQRKCVRGTVLRGAGAVQVGEELAHEGFPAILIAERCDNACVSFVDAESRRSSQQAVEHLIALGHRRIAIGMRRALDTDHRDRLDGYRDALRSAGIEHDDRLTAHAASDQAGGVEILDRMLRLDDPPTAIYFTTPLATVGALYRCAELGLSVPRDLSIVGFDEGDTRLQTFPRYTAVCQNARQLAVEATAWLVDQIEKPSRTPHRVLHKTTLRLHESTGPAPSMPVRLPRCGGGAVV